MGTLRACADAMRAKDRRHKNDGRSVAAWLRDNGLVGFDMSMRDVVLYIPRAGSRRLERLGFLQAHPNLNASHAAEVQGVLVRRYERQSGQDGPSTERLSQELQRILPQADKRR
jgi:hypothetical protein